MRKAIEMTLPERMNKNSLSPPMELRINVTADAA